MGGGWGEAGGKRGKWDNFHNSLKSTKYERLKKGDELLIVGVEMLGLGCIVGDTLPFPNLWGWTEGGGTTMRGGGRGGEGGPLPGMGQKGIITIVS